MSVESVVFVTAGKDKTVDVGNAVTKALNSWLRSKLKLKVAELGARNTVDFLRSGIYEGDSRWTDTVAVSSYNFNILSIEFGCGDGDFESAKRRVLSFYPDCSSESRETFEGDKLIFSIGCWGSYKEIMAVVSGALKPFGRVFYCENDSDADFEELK